MQKLPVLILSLLLFPAIASAQSAGPPPPPPDPPDVETTRPPDAEPDVQPPAPPAVPPSRAQASDDDQVGILQQRSGDGVGILQGSDEDAYREQPGPASPPPTVAPRPTGQWVYTSQYGWVWMPYSHQYVDEATYGADTPYQYVYSMGLGWSWVAAPWLWGWGVYPYFGVLGPSHFGWYRGLYRSGYGWEHYRGGHPRGGYDHGGRPYAGRYARGGAAYHATRPIGGGYVSRGSTKSYGGTRLQGAGRIYRGSPARSGSFPGGSRTQANGTRGGSGPRAGGDFHGGGGHWRR